MVFQFEHVDIDHGPESKWDVRAFDLVDLKRVLAKWQTGLGEIGWNSLYWNNHDQPRVVSRFGSDGEYREESAKLLGTVLHLLRGTPFVYQGEELGMTNGAFAELADFRDIESLNYFAEAAQAERDDVVLEALRKVSRDNARTPMQWTAEAEGGFTTGVPWIAVNPNHSSINAVTQYGTADSVFEYYRRLIALRHSEQIITSGAFRLLLPDDPKVMAYLRTTAERELLVLANFSDGPTGARHVPGAENWADASQLIGNYAGHAAQPLELLRPWEAVVLDRPAR